MRYIDADALIKKIYPMGIGDGKYTINAKDVKLAIDNTPTADVVPKREVFLASSDAMKMLIECHGYALTHDADIKKGVAREIFEAINEDCFDQFGYFDYETYAALKKKYTEKGE